MKYEGELEDLVKFTAESMSEKWLILFQSTPYILSNKHTFKLKSGALTALRTHIYANFCQGHYWHKGKDNTFAKEKGWERNNHPEKEFKKMAKEMSDYLLKEKIFQIIQIKDLYASTNK
ncbi:MAG: hypothetical protein ABIP51_18270 [Bacteroidia bacterium]